MVKLFAPCLSLDASGTVGKAITFSKWKGRNYMRERVKPANPKSGMQVGMRAMMKFLAQQWANLSSAQQTDWESRADDLVASPFNAYVSYNQRRWRNHQTPSKLDPATETGTVPTYSTSSATGGVRMATISMTYSVANDGWGFCIHRGTASGFDKTLDNVIAIVLNEGTTAVQYVDSPLAAGTYYYAYRTFTDDGVLSGAVAEDSCVVT